MLTATSHRTETTRWSILLTYKTGSKTTMETFYTEQEPGAYTNTVSDLVPEGSTYVHATVIEDGWSDGEPESFVREDPYGRDRAEEFE